MAEQVVIVARLDDELSRPLQRVQTEVKQTAQAVTQSGTAASASGKKWAVAGAQTSKAGAQAAVAGKAHAAGANEAAVATDRLAAAQARSNSLMGKMKGSWMGAGAGMLAAFAGFQVATGFVTGAIEAAKESVLTVRRLNAIAESMGVLDTVLGGTTQRLTDYAQTLQNQTGISDEVVKSGQAILLTFADIASTSGEAGGLFDRATASLLDLSAAGFGDATSNAKSMGRALNDPIKGLTALSRQGVTFTEVEREKVKALVASGKKLEAQNVIMHAVEVQVGGTAAAVATSMDKMSAAWADAQENWGLGAVSIADALGKAFGGPDGAISLFDQVGKGWRQNGEGVALFIGQVKTMTEAVSASIPGLAETVRLLDGMLASYGGIVGMMQMTPLALVGQAIDGVNGALHEGTVEWARWVSRTDGATASVKDANGKWHTFQGGIEMATDAAGNIIGPLGEVEDATVDVATAADKAATKVTNFRNLLRDLSGDHRSTVEAISAMEAAFDNLGGAVDNPKTKVKETTAALTANRKAFDLTRASGRRASDALTGVAGAAEAAATAAANEGKWKLAQRLLEQGNRKIAKQAEKWGLSEAAAQTYADTILGIPTSVTTTAYLKTIGQYRPMGDTASPHGSGGSVARTLAGHGAAARAAGGGLKVTNLLTGGGGLGFGSGDHQAGRAVDVQGARLGAYVRAVREAGGFAEFHGTGSGRHAHSVPAGDTASPRSRGRGQGGGGDVVQVGPFHFTGVSAADQAAIKATVRAALREAQRERVERGAR